MVDYKTRKKAIFCDIDGTLLKHNGSTHGVITKKPELLSGVLERFDHWDERGYTIIIITGRRESLREVTENQLREFGLFWDYLIMGLGPGARLLIGDNTPDGDITNFAISLERDSGFNQDDFEKIGF